MITIIEEDIKRAKRFLSGLDLEDIQKIMEGMRCGEIFENLKAIVTEDEYNMDTAKQYAMMTIEYVYGLWQTNFESKELWYDVTGQPEFSIMNDDIFELTEKNMKNFVETASGEEITKVLKERITTHVKENDEMFYRLFKILEEGNSPVHVGCIAYFAIMYGLWRYEEAL